jgi:hypothetical protein
MKRIYAIAGTKVMTKEGAGVIVNHLRPVNACYPKHYVMVKFENYVQGYAGKSKTYMYEPRCLKSI